MVIPTEPIGSIPRTADLLAALADVAAGRLPAAELDGLYEAAVRDTVREFEATGSPVISDGEQRKFHNFASYAVEGLPNVTTSAFTLDFVDGHSRTFPQLTAGPFRYDIRADSFLDAALRHARVPVKQAVISPSALSLFFYPTADLPDYPRTAFVADLLNEHEAEVRACLRKGAHAVQIDFTEGRLAVKIDPTGELLASMVRLNNLALNRFSADDRRRIGVHTCPGGDCDSTHSADVDYSELLPSLFELNADNFYVALARERDPERVLGTIRDFRKPDQRVFVGVIDPLDPRVETAEEVRDRVLAAARYIPPSHLGTTDDCGFAPFCDDVSTSRETAFAKIRARVAGTALAARALGAGP